MTDMTRCPYCGSSVDLHARGPITGMWLDQPAIIDGEPITLGNTFPLSVKIYAVLFGVGTAFVFGTLVWVRIAEMLR